MEFATAKRTAFLLFILIWFITPAQGGAQVNPTWLDSTIMAVSDPVEMKAPAQSRDWLYTALEVNYVLLNAVDLITTLKGMEHGAREANPIARAFVKNKPLAVFIKGAATGGVLFALSRAKRQDRKAAFVTLSILNLMYGVVVHNNIGVYLEIRR